MVGSFSYISNRAFIHKRRMISQMIAGITEEIFPAKSEGNRFRGKYFSNKNTLLK